MQVTNIAGKSFTTIASMKQFAIENGMSITGSSKWVKSQWVERLESFMEVKAELVKTAVDADQVSQDAAEVIEVAALSVGSLVVAALTSEAAIGGYRGALKFVLFAIVITWMFAAKAVRWCWERRHQTALYCWIEQWLDSPSGKDAIAQLLICEWVLNAWVEAIGVRVGEVGDRVLVRLGLGGGAIEIQ